MLPDRSETDSFGTLDVPADRLWGAQTQRALEHFAISNERMPREMWVAIAQVKRAAAEVNQALGRLEARKAGAIAQAAQEVIDGLLDAHFPLGVWQTGSGTQTHMNLNEVLANRASQLLGGPVGPQRLVHPNDEVNLGQSSNDVFPTAMNLAAVQMLEGRVRPALARLRETLHGLALAHADLVKIGRTHLQDATPLTLGQEISGWAAQLAHAERHLQATLPHLRELAIGGTAVGTGLNTHPEFGERVAERLSAACGTRFVSASNKFEALAAHDALVAAHGALKGLAVALTKVANDVRWLASGPRCGLGELRLPENEPGSSIMPGKVNPTQCEALVMVGCQVLGNDVAMGLAGAAGSLELNTCKPLMAHLMLQSARLLADAMDSFERHCVRGIEPDRERIAAHLRQSLMLVTALVPHLGYDRAARIALRAHREGLSLQEAAQRDADLDAATFESWVQPNLMTRPGP